MTATITGVRRNAGTSAINVRSGSTGRAACARTSTLTRASNVSCLPAFASASGRSSLPSTCYAHSCLTPSPRLHLVIGRALIDLFHVPSVLLPIPRMRPFIQRQIKHAKAHSHAQPGEAARPGPSPLGAGRRRCAWPIVLLDKHPGCSNHSAHLHATRVVRFGRCVCSCRRRTSS